MVVTKVICDVCGAEKENLSAIHIEHNFISGSSYDGCTIELDVCERCFENKIIKKIPEAIRERIITAIPF